MSAEQLARRSSRLSEQRTSGIELLQAIARERRRTSLVLRWLGGSRITRRMVGLPDDVTACVFDLDGVLTTSAEVHAAAWADTFDAFLLGRAERLDEPFVGFDSAGDYRSSFAGRLRLDGVRTFLAGRGISLPEGTPDDPPDAETVHGLANRKSEALRLRLESDSVTAFEGSRLYLECIRVLGVRRAVVSASANTAEIMERSGLVQLIDQRIDRDTIEVEQLRVKPAADTLLAACRHLGVEPAQAVAFETTVAGISAARTAGYRLAIGVERSHESSALRAGEPDRVIGDLAELLDQRA